MPKRKINFFKVEITKLEEQSNTIIPIANQSQIAVELFSNINNLLFAYDTLNTRYMNIAGGNEISMYVESITNEKVEGKIVVCRRKNLPDVEQNGILSQLDIPLTAGLAEATHFVYYFNARIIAIEFNFYGPRSSHISDYIEKKCNSIIAQFKIAPVIKAEFDRALLTNEVALFQIEAHRNAVEVVNELQSDLGSAFRAASTASTSEIIEIVLRKKPYARSGFLPFINLDNLTNIFRRDDNRELINKLRVAVLDESNGGKIKHVDLLADKLSVSKDVELENERRRRINSASMFIAINEAYIESRHELLIENRCELLTE